MTCKRYVVFILWEIKTFIIIIIIIIIWKIESYTHIDLHAIQIKDNIYSIELEIRSKPPEIVIFCALHEK